MQTTPATRARYAGHLGVFGCCRSPFINIQLILSPFVLSHCSLVAEDLFSTLATLRYMVMIVDTMKHVYSRYMRRILHAGHGQ